MRGISGDRNGVEVVGCFGFANTALDLSFFLRGFVRGIERSAFILRE